VSAARATTMILFMVSFLLQRIAEVPAEPRCLK
jgi:hypothetical protein